MEYIISAPEKTDWSIGRAAFVQALHLRWPDADIELAPKGNALTTRDVVWETPCTDGPMEGSLDQAGQSVFLEGPIRAMAEFAEWWRHQVPVEQPLLMYDEGYNVSVELNKSSRASDIEAAFALSAENVLSSQLIGTENGS